MAATPMTVPVRLAVPRKFRNRRGRIVRLKYVAIAPTPTGGEAMTFHKFFWVGLIALGLTHPATAQDAAKPDAAKPDAAKQEAAKQEARPQVEVVFCLDT